VKINGRILTAAHTMLARVRFSSSFFREKPNLGQFR
jgi:hypothetical protein